MDRPRLLLVPGFTELEWTIAPLLTEWADVASFDPPGIGDEPPPSGGFGALTRKDIADRGIAELDRRGWESCVLLADGWGVASAALIAAERPEAIEGIALGHALLSYESEGESPAMSGAVRDAMTELMRQADDSFVRYGITQMTQGGYDEELAEEIVGRMPSGGMAEVWQRMAELDRPIDELLGGLDCPMLLAKHEGCILYTDEGFAAAAKAFPEARTIALPGPPCANPDFAAAVRDTFAAS